MSAAINFHGPYEYRPKRYRDEGDSPYVSLRIGAQGNTLWLYLNSRADADELVKAALAARDLLPEPDIDPATLNDALAGAEPEPCWATCPGEPLAQCTRDGGHEGDHRADGARGNDDPPLTWPQALPPAKYCPVCSAKLDANGRHVTRSGATIPAAEVAQ
jgi:hypothetical protein